LQETNTLAYFADRSVTAKKSFAISRPVEDPEENLQAQGEDDGHHIGGNFGIHFVSSSGTNPAKH
jgi:hypothetical protein